MRAASGLPPSGGATIDQVRRGLTARYGFAGTKAVGFTALWAAMTPGTAACAQGSMGAFALGHSLRRHLPSFTGIHQVTIFRLDATDRVWWCDPLAPAVGYIGEWVSKAQLAAYVNAFAANGHTVAPLQEDPMIPVPSVAFNELVNKKTSLVSVADFHAERLLSAPVLKRFPADTDFVPVGSANEGSPAGGPTPTLWYFGFMSIAGGVIGGWFHSSGLGPLTANEVADCSAVEHKLTTTKAELVVANDEINDLAEVINVKNAALDAAVLHEKSHVDLSAALQAARSK